MCGLVLLPCSYYHLIPTFSLGTLSPFYIKSRQSFGEFVTAVLVHTFCSVFTGLDDGSTRHRMFPPEGGVQVLCETTQLLIRNVTLLF